MKKKKIFCVWLAIAILINGINMPDVFAAGIVKNAVNIDNEGIMPLWTFTIDYHLNLTFSGDTANCSLMVTGKSNAERVRASLFLFEEEDDGSWTLLDSWLGIESSSRYFITEQYYSPVYKGRTYKLYFTARCYGPNDFYDMLADQTIVTY